MICTTKLNEIIQVSIQKQQLLSVINRGGCGYFAEGFYNRLSNILPLEFYSAEDGKSGYYCHIMLKYMNCLIDGSGVYEMTNDGFYIFNNYQYKMQYKVDRQILQEHLKCKDYWNDVFTSKKNHFRKLDRALNDINNQVRDAIKKNVYVRLR